MRGSLRLSLTLLIAVVVVAPAVLGGLLLYWGARAEVRDQVLGRMDAIADRTSTSIGQVMAERLGDAETFAERAYVRERCAQLIDGRPAPGETPQSLQDDLSAQLESVTTVFGHYIDGVIVDLQSGRAIASRLPEGAKPEELVKCAELADGTEITGVRMAPAHLHIVSRRPVVGVVAPIHRPGPGGAHSRAVAALVLHVDLEQALHTTIDDRIGMGQSGEVVLVDQEGRPLRKPRWRSGGVLGAPLPPAIWQLAVAGQNGIVDGLDYRGVRVLGAYRYLPAQKWGLVVKMDAAEAYHAIAHLGRLTAGILVGLALIATSLSWMVSGGICQPILELSQAARRVAAGDLEARIALKRRDELGVMAEDFNAMVGDLAASHERVQAALQELRNTNEQLNTEIEHRQEVEAALQEAVGNLEQANAELALVLSVASHDLREPLRGVVGSMQLIGRRHASELPAPALDLLDRALQSAKRLNSLMEAILSYARLGHAALSPQPVSCTTLCNRALEDLQPLVQESGATVDCGGLPEVVADETLLGRVFHNLLGNAIRHRGEEPPRVRVAAERQDDEWLFTVSDNGTGVSPEDADLIFQPFARLAKGADDEGSGVGLAICRRAIARHGGRIWVESERGKGASFCFTLPAQAATERDGTKGEDWEL